MVQIPTYEARVGLDAPAYPAVRVDDSIGQGLRAVGDAVAGIGEHIKAREKQKAAFSASVGYDRLNEQLNQDLIDAKKNAPPDGTGLHDDFVAKSVTPKADAFLASIQDPELKQQYSERLKLLSDTWSNNAANGEYELGNGYSLNAIDSSWKLRARGISQSPTEVKAYLKEMTTLVDNAPNLTSTQREDLKRKMSDAAPGIVAEALKQKDPETFYFATGNGTQDERLAFLTKRLTPALEAAGARPVSKEGGARISSLLGQFKGDAEAATVAYVAGPDAAAKWIEKGRDYAALSKDVEPLVRKTLGNLGTAQLASGAPRSNDVPKGDALAAIRAFESFRPNAYWDVNAYRTGYGSDTITHADGTVEKVTQASRVTREDAERDLARRAKEFQAGAAAKVGADTWGKLPSGAQAALTSIAYNYGELPDSVAAAARTGNAATLAAAIRARGSDNNGVNRERRNKEAAMVSGDYSPPASGQMTATEGSPLPMDGAQRSGFVSDAFATMPVASLLEAQGSAADLRMKLDDTVRREKEAAGNASANMIANDLASIAQTGKGVVSAADFDAKSAEVLKTLGPDRHSAWLEDRLVAQRTYDLTNDVTSMTGESMIARLKQLKPTGGANAVVDGRVFDNVSKKFSDVQTLRIEDPGLAVQQMPDLKDAAAKVDWSKPQLVQDYLSQVEAAQAMLQLPNRGLLPKSHAEQLGTQFRNILRANPGNEDEATKAFLGKLEQTYGTYADDVFTQSYETILDKDISKPVRDMMTGLVLDWARERPGMLDQRYAVASELAAADQQPSLADAAPAERGWFDYLTGAPPPAPKAAPKPAPAPAPRAVAPITIDGVPADAVDTYIKNPGSMKIQTMFRNIYGADRLKAMQEQLRARGMVEAAS